MRSKARISSHPVHPMIVMFPFGLWVASFVFDLLGRASGNPNLFSAGYFCLIGGCVGAACAAVPGAIDLFGTVPPDSSARKRGYIHAGMNVIALLLTAFGGGTSQTFQRISVTGLAAATQTQAALAAAIMRWSMAALLLAGAVYLAASTLKRRAPSRSDVAPNDGD